MNDRNLRIVLASRPSGAVQETNFRLEEVPLPEIGDGRFLVRNHYLSLDPYMRGRMNDTKSYARCVAIGEVMVGGTVGEVIASRHPGYQPGDMVSAPLGWQLYGVSDGGGAHKIEDRRLPLSAHLGVLGMPGVTAYVGLLDIGQPKHGETVVVSAASGAVGSAVGQIARMQGCRAVGIAGGPEKCRYVVEELGFDACIDYKTGRLDDDLRAATPDGVDVCFENVGGTVFDTVLKRLNAFARVPLCGLVSDYNALEPYGVKNIRSILTNRVRLQGFIIFDHLPRWPAAQKDLAQWVLDGRLKYRESVAQGLENAPAAFIGMLAGRNFGKQIVKLV